MLLADEELSRTIGSAGRAEVLAKHLPVHRARRLEAKLQSLTKSFDPCRYYSWTANLSWAVQTLHDDYPHFAAYAAFLGIKAIREGLSRKEPLDEDLSRHLVFLCLEFDRMSRVQDGKVLLQELVNEYPSISILVVARVWLLLNAGAREEANGIVERLGHKDPQSFFREVQQVMEELVLTT